MKVKKYRLRKDDENRTELLLEKELRLPIRFQKVNDTERAIQVFKSCAAMTDDADEHMYMLCLDRSARPVAFFELSHGGEGYTPTPLRETLVKAAIANATYLILAHNHPGGDPTASPEDKKSIRSLVLGCKLIGMELLDSLIFTQDDVCSMYDTNSELWKK